MQSPIDEYLLNRHTPQDVNLKHKNSLAAHDRLALLVTTAIGSMYAVYLLIVLSLAWILWQSLSSQPFDPYPFAFLLFIGNLLQLILMPLIMVGQNIQNRHAQIKADEEFKTTNSIYKDIEKLLIHVDAIQNHLTKS